MRVLEVRTTDRNPLPNLSSSSSSLFTCNATMWLKSTQVSQLQVAINKISEKAKQERQKASTHNKQVTQNKPYSTHIISSA